MAWQDRDYNRGGGTGDFLSNPAGILALSMPFGTWLGVRVRLHFWLLLAIAFDLAGLLSHASPILVFIQIALLLAALLLHDFGHRAFAQWVGGRLDEFMLWPAGGMVFPTTPPGAWTMFVAHVGGIAVNFALAVGSIVLLYLYKVTGFDFPLDPLSALSSQGFAVLQGRGLLIDSLYTFAFINCTLVFVNFLPYYWFDGGYLLQSLLWPFVGGAAALNITCIIGMIVAAPMFAISLMNRQIFGLILWALLFSSSYNARHTMEVAEAMPAEHGWRTRRWAQRGSTRAAAKRRQLEQKIDAILAKVSEKGMQSLTWSEKRTLRKASEKLK